YAQSGAGRIEPTFSRRRTEVTPTFLAVKFLSGRVSLAPIPQSSRTASLQMNVPEKQMPELLGFSFLAATLFTVLVTPSLSWSNTVSCTHRLTWTDDVVRANAVVALNRNEAKQQLELLVSDGCLNTVKDDLQKLGG